MQVTKPYVLRAVKECLDDLFRQAYIDVDCSFGNYVVPEQFITNNVITLNISVDDLIMDEERVQFNGIWSGQNIGVYVPLKNILAIRDKEGNVGQSFSIPESDKVSSAVPTKVSAPKLVVISGGKS